MGITIAPIPYVIPSTSGNVLTSNGSIWTSASAPSSAVIASTITTSFETAGRFSSTVTNSASVTFDSDGCLIKSSADGASGGSEALLWRIGDIAAAGAGSMFAGSPMFSASVRIQNLGNTNGTTFYLGIGNPTVASAGHTFTVAHIGFKFVTSGGVMSLFATQADGTETASSALTTVASSDKLDLILKVNSTTSVDYYWRKNGGALSAATNLATHLPTSAASNIQFSASSDGFVTLGAFYMFGSSYSR